MAIILTDETALAFWRHSGITGSSLFGTRPCRLARVPSKVAPASDITAACEQFCLDVEPIDVLVGRKCDVRHSKGISYSVFSGSLPSQSVCRLDSDMYVTSPKFTFVRLARRMAQIQLIRLGYEMAGSFASNHLDFRGFSKCPAMFSIKELTSFLDHAKGVQGSGPARQAAKHMLDNAASPMEAELAMILTLPRRLGGYGLPKPELNYRLNLGTANGFVLSRTSIIVDLAWPERKLVLEYDSDQFHTGSEKIAADSERRNDIELLGYDVQTVTNKEISSIGKTDKIAKTVASKLGVRIRSEGDGFMGKQVELRRTLVELRSGHKSK